MLRFKDPLSRGVVSQLLRGAWGREYYLCKAVYHAVKLGRLLQFFYINKWCRGISCPEKSPSSRMPLKAFIFEIPYTEKLHSISVVTAPEIL